LSLKKQELLANYIGTIRDFGGNSVVDRLRDYAKVDDKTTTLLTNKNNASEIEEGDATSIASPIKS